MNRKIAVRMADGRQHIVEYPDSPLMAGVVESILSRNEYPVIQFLQSSARIIVDIGANIGCSAVLFASQYPAATIYALEPGRDAFEFLQRNTQGLSQVKPFQVGGYNKDASAELFHGADASVTNSLVPNVMTSREKESVCLRRISTFLAEQSITHISLLKIDTEGAEIAILEDLAPAFGAIDCMFVEYHSEADRLAIDQMLAPQFTLFFGRSEHPHRGTWCYVSKFLLATMTQWNSVAISHPKL